MVRIVHPQAYVEHAVLGEGVIIRQFASVTGGTVLGDGCSVSPFAMLHGPRFGKRCVIQGGVMMGPGFVFGDDCFVGPNVTLCNDMWPTADKEGLDLEAMRSGEFVTVLCGDRVTIGAGAILLPGVTIGNGAVVAAGAVVAKDVPGGYLYKRSNEIVKITAEWTKRRRMRAVRC